MIGLSLTDTRELLDQNLDIIMPLHGDEPVTAETATHKLYDARLHLRPYTEPHFDIAVAAVADRPAARGPLRTGPAVGRRHAHPGGLRRARAPLGHRRGARPGLRARRWTARSGGSSAWCMLPRPVSRPTRTSSTGSSSGSGYFERVAAFPQMGIEGDHALREMVEFVNTSGVGAIGTWEDVAAQIEKLTTQSNGGFGCYLMLAHEWANPAATKRSYELIAQHVMPLLPGACAADDRAPARAPQRRTRDGEDPERRRRAHDGEVRAGGRGEPGLVVSLPPYATTGVGSLPHADPVAAVRHVLRAYDVPFCPQLPRAEGDMVREWLRRKLPACGWSPDRDRERPAAWDVFVAAVRAAPPAHGVVKLQATGPATLATALEGPGDAGLAREISTWLAANAAGQVRRLHELGLGVILLVDEPGLASAGVAGALQRCRQRGGTRDLQLHDPVRGGRGADRRDERVPRGRALAVAIGTPAAGGRLAAEPLADHVALRARELRAERHVVGAQDVTDRGHRIGVGQAPHAGRGVRRQRDH